MRRIRPVSLVLLLSSMMMGTLLVTNGTFVFGETSYDQGDIPGGEEPFLPKGIGDVIHSFPSPGLSPGGLTWDGNRLWHADYGTDKVYTIDPVTGVATEKFSCPGPSAGGLAWQKELFFTYLWISDAANDWIYQCRPADGRVFHSFASPGSGPLGLAWDGTYLWNADWVTNKVYKINPSTGAVISSFNTPDTRPNGLTWDGTHLWLVTRDANKIWKLTTSGVVVDSFSSPGSNPKGLTWDGKYLWNSDLATDTIYQIDVEEPLWDYSFRLNPWIDIIRFNLNPGGWINGICDAPGFYTTPVLGKYEGGYAYFACDLPDDLGPYRMSFFYIRPSTMDGYYYRIRDDLSLDGPLHVWATLVAGESEGLAQSEAVDSWVAPAAVYTMRLNPYFDVYHLSDGISPWIWGWSEYPGPPYPGEVLGYVRGNRFFLGTDWNDETAGAYEISLIAGTLSSADGYWIRTVDGHSYNGPGYVYFTMTSSEGEGIGPGAAVD